MEVEYSLVLTTYKHPVEAGMVLKEIDATTQGFSKEILVIGHEESDRPIGDNLPEYKFIAQPKKGCANSIWYGASICNGRWFVWLCDDHKYPQRDWLKRADDKRKNNSKLRVIRFYAHEANRNCAQIGTAEKKWYLEHYPEPVYEHYGWDDEIAHWAREEGVYLNAEDIVIQDVYDDNRINWERKRRDGALNELRLKEYKLINGKITKVS